MNNDNELFRQALQRQNDRAARMKMPDDMEQRVMRSISPRPLRWERKSRKSWGMGLSLLAIAASILLLIMFHFKKDTTDEPDIIAQQTVEQPTPQPALQPNVEEKKQETLAEVKPMPKPAKKRRKEVRVLVELIPTAEAETTLTAAAEPEEDIQQSHPLRGEDGRGLSTDQDPFVAMAVQTQDIRLRGKRLEEEIIAFMNN